MTPSKPRKMPKNQRPYATPSGKKARMVKLTPSEWDEMCSAKHQIDRPHTYIGTDGMYASADQMRKWRAGNPPTSGTDL